MIGNKIEAVTAIYGNVKGIVLDKITETEVVYKYSQDEASSKGMNYTDGSKVIKYITKYV